MVSIVMPCIQQAFFDLQTPDRELYSPNGGLLEPCNVGPDGEHPYTQF